MAILSDLYKNGNMMLQGQHIQIPLILFHVSYAQIFVSQESFFSCKMNLLESVIIPQ